MHKYRAGDIVSFIDVLKQKQQGTIQDLVPTGGFNAYTIKGYDFLVLEKNITERIARVEKKKVD